MLHSLNAPLPDAPPGRFLSRPHPATPADIAQDVASAPPGKRILKIGGNSRVKNIAGAIAHVSRAGEPPTLLALGSRWEALTRLDANPPSEARTAPRGLHCTVASSAHIHGSVSDFFRVRTHLDPPDAAL